MLPYTGIQTTLARIVSRVSHEKLGTRFTQLSATTAGVKDVKEVVQKAKNEWALLKRRTILFIDEIHRFNKLQQVQCIRMTIAAGLQVTYFMHEASQVIY